MTATEEIAEHCDAASGLRRGAVPIAVWILLIQFAAQLIATCYPDSEDAAKVLRERGLLKKRVVRRIKWQARKLEVPKRYRTRIGETIYVESVHATSGLMTAIWHDGLVHADPTL